MCFPARPEKMLRAGKRAGVNDREQESTTGGEDCPGILGKAMV
jgi:hypothetical protein